MGNRNCFIKNYRIIYYQLFTIDKNIIPFIIYISGIYTFTIIISSQSSVDRTLERFRFHFRIIKLEN